MAFGSRAKASPCCAKSCSASDSSHQSFRKGIHLHSTIVEVRRRARTRAVRPLLVEDQLGLGRDGIALLDNLRHRTLHEAINRPKERRRAAPKAEEGVV